jgi:hypothetical protein
LKTPLVSKKNFISIHNESSLDSIEDSYESFKNFNFNILLNHLPIKLTSSYGINPYTYTKVIDPFRADYEEFL